MAVPITTDDPTQGIKANFENNLQRNCESEGEENPFPRVKPQDRAQP